MTVDPIDLKALEFVLLKGKPAPEFVEVAGWSGKPVRLSEMKGQYVLVRLLGLLVWAMRASDANTDRIAREVQR